MRSSVLLYLLPLISAFLGWLIAKISVLIYVSLLLKKKAQIGNAIGVYIEQQISLDTIEQQLIAPETIEKILPFAETHVDAFLRVKLPAAMPMLAMFISDKMVVDMKGIFMNELKELFPALMQQYISNVKKDFNISQLISARLNAISSGKIRAFVGNNYI